jgi:hypothetical protein
LIVRGRDEGRVPQYAFGRFVTPINSGYSTSNIVHES